MKKISIMLLAALMLFAFVACDDKTPAPEAATAEEAKLAGDFIDTLNQQTILGHLTTALEDSTNHQAAGGTFKAEADENNVITVTLKKYDDGLTNSVTGITAPSIESGTVVLTLKDAEGKNVAFASIANAKKYDVTVTSVKFVSGDDSVTMSFKASGTIESNKIVVPSTVTDLKVLFNGTEKSVTWANIYKNTDQGASANK